MVLYALDSGSSSLGLIVTCGLCVVLLSQCVCPPRCKKMGTSEFNAMRNTVSDGLASNPDEVGILYKYWDKLTLSST